MEVNIQVKHQRRVSVIVLAAGTSSRMGEDNKLLLDLGGQSLIRRTVNTLLQHAFTEVIVVLGHEASRIQSELADMDVRTVINADYQQGQMTSVHCGMSAISRQTDGIMVFLSDLALIDEGDLQALRQGFDQCHTGVLVPTYEGKRGNPIILKYAQRQSIVDGDKNLGCKKLISKHPELVTSLPMSCDHVLVDMDTPQAYQEVLNRIETTDKLSRFHPQQKSEAC